MTYNTVAALVKDLTGDTAFADELQQRLDQDPRMVWSCPCGAAHIGRYAPERCSACGAAHWEAIL